MKTLRRAALLGVLLCSFVPIAHAAYDAVPITTVTLKRGSSNVTKAEVTAACAKIPDCSMPLTEDNCIPIQDLLLAEEGAARETGGSVYQCLIAKKAVVTFKANPPPPTCGARPGVDEQATRTCPPGTVGTWIQDRVWTLRPHPQCWVQGDWAPQTPAEGMCAPIDYDGDGVPDLQDTCPLVAARTPDGCPLPEVQWISCANEFQTCRFIGARRVRFGVDTRWVERELTAPSTGGVPCRVATFGSDPAVGVAKRCELRPEAVIRACSSLVCDVSWTPDGPSDGFRIVFGREPQVLASTVQVPGTVRREFVRMPAVGPWYFGVKACNGELPACPNESELSNIIVRDVQ